MPIGILVARHTKLWAGFSQAWFYTHILAQLAGYTLGIVGWAYGVWLKVQPSANLAVYPQYAHFCIGITIFCTATLQVKLLKSRLYCLFQNNVDTVCSAVLAQSVLYYTVLKDGLLVFCFQ